uniref:Uncharacterized protein n=1 Tax=Sphaerodactylus townsendi TaxID=933632 RepID=A0ACB8E4I0_9SAUR
MPSLTPQVHWAQRHRELYLRVELSDVQDPGVTITDNVLHFKAKKAQAKGCGVSIYANGRRLPLTTELVCRVTQRQLNITVKKQESHWWERLTKQEKRPLFLTPDFDRWLDESDAEMELKAKEEERINKINIENRIPKDHSFFDTFHATSDMMYLCQTLAVMEIVNTLIGLVRAPLVPILLQKLRVAAWVSPPPPSVAIAASSFQSLPLQVFGRNFILFVVLGGVEEMQSKAVVFFVFYSWSLVEIFRYPFYMLSCIDIQWKALTWIRYSIWIPLYPLGILAEAVTVIQAIPVFSRTGRFSFSLPSPLSVTVPFSVVLQLYLVALFLGPFVNFRHLYKQRKRHLGPKKRKTH